MFPDGFVWGVSTSAYQIEGGAGDGGRGASIWDEYCRQPGKVYAGQSGEVACDHYHRWKEDVELIREMGVNAYRFSISWPRVLPEGRAGVSDAGIGFYDRLVDELMWIGVTPFVTLFHWDFPLALYRRGGWLSPDAPRWFAEYVQVVVDRLSDRVHHWVTINEPQCFLKFGHADGTNAPGLRLGLADQLMAAHQTLVAHGMGVQAIRARTRSTAQVGWSPATITSYPSSQPDLEAARAEMFRISRSDLWNNTWFNDPVFLGRYPEDGLRLFGDAAPRFGSSDMATISQPLDFLGLNIFEGQPITTNESGKPVPTSRPIGHPLTAFRWPVDAAAMRYGPLFMHQRYKTPIYITENGMSNIDWVGLDEAVHDPQRIDFTRRYLLALRDGIADGADVRGYFHFSLLDNFEWAEGFKERFGLVYVDYATQQRTPKDSAAWYSTIAGSNGAAL